MTVPVHRCVQTSFLTKWIGILLPLTFKSKALCRRSFPTSGVVPCSRSIKESMLVGKAWTERACTLMPRNSMASVSPGEAEPPTTGTAAPRRRLFGNQISPWTVEVFIEFWKLNTVLGLASYFLLNNKLLYFSHRCGYIVFSLVQVHFHYSQGWGRRQFSAWEESCDQM